jgi:hypothetical protein
MELTANLLAIDATSCTLVGHAEVIVNGKFAQFGGRMMGSVSDMILAQFAEVFSQKAAVVQAALQPVSHAPVSGGDAPAPAAATPAAPQAPVVAKEFNALGLVWALIKGFFANLFGSKRSA